MRESDLLQHVFTHNHRLPASVTIGPGDDMGAVRIGNQDVLVTVDQLADGVHFVLENTPIEKIARKAITRNLSDVAAMAAIPDGAVVAASLPRKFTSDKANRLFDAMRTTAEAYQCPLMGGDVSIWEGPLLLTVTVFAHCEGHMPVLRSGAQVGDVICVTGRLGGSLHTMGEYTHHLDFEPRVSLAQKLAANRDIKLHSMIDLSDGLATDLSHICRLSNVAAQIHVDRLPISEAARETASGQSGKQPWQHALGDGEDYELCLTVSARDAEKSLPADIEGNPLTPIGVIVAERASSGPRVELIMPDGAIEPCDAAGWDHH